MKGYVQKTDISRKYGLQRCVYLGKYVEIVLNLSQFMYPSSANIMVQTGP